MSLLINPKSHHHWAVVVSRGWVKASACRLPVSLSCVVLCQIVSLQYTCVQVVSPPLGWSTLSYFLVVLYPSGDHRGPSVVFEAVDVLCYPGPLHSRLCLWLLFFLWPGCWCWCVSLYVMLSILVCAAASLFCACLVSVWKWRLLERPKRVVSVVVSSPLYRPVSFCWMIRKSFIVDDVFAGRFLQKW